MRAMSVALVLLNPRAAGGRAAALLEPVRSWLAREAPGARLLETRSPDEAQVVLRELDEGGRVVAIGGDGTLHHLLGPLLDAATRSASCRWQRQRQRTGPRPVPSAVGAGAGSTRCMRRRRRSTAAS